MVRGQLYNQLSADIQYHVTYIIFSVWCEVSCTTVQPAISRHTISRDLHHLLSMVRGQLYNQLSADIQSNKILEKRFYLVQELSTAASNDMNIKKYFWKVCFFTACKSVFQILYRPLYLHCNIYYIGLNKPKFEKIQKVLCNKSLLCST